MRSDFVFSVSRIISISQFLKIGCIFRRFGSQLRVFCAKFSTFWTILFRWKMLIWTVICLLRASLKPYEIVSPLM